ncbi:toxin [Microtetraspora sp. NBRC 13810]|uniref:DUF397 domain-containing protein n=1 Tax=Microtetraspora sp. NBRC 13810 TaxID=3030990 RepID=UPI0024A27467|nr:DUF397 domain-containing protein [Microtetraspora sp. NBRC 13810]GLW05369.1 toxin [Microtetraspora sp. NBRC 13810]
MEAEDLTGVDLFRAAWKKSSHSGDNGGNCVEVAGLPRLVAVRDSKDPGGPVLVFAPGEWRAFLAGVKLGQFDRLA